MRYQVPCPLLAEKDLLYIGTISCTTLYIIFALLASTFCSKDKIASLLRALSRSE